MKTVNGTVISGQGSVTSSASATVTPGTGTVTVTSSGSVTVELGGFLKSPAGQQQLGQIRDLRAAQAATAPVKDEAKKKAAG